MSVVSGKEQRDANGQAAFGYVGEQARSARRHAGGLEQGKGELPGVDCDGFRHCDPADVLLVEVPNQSGAFGKICERLAADHLNIDYAYCSFNSAGAARGAKTGVLAVIKVNDLGKAQRILGENGGAAVRTVQRKPSRRPGIGKGLGIRD
jgi:hypothetical protein